MEVCIFISLQVIFYQQIKALRFFKYEKIKSMMESFKILFFSIFMKFAFKNFKFEKKAKTTFLNIESIILLIFF